MAWRRARLLHIVPGALVSIAADAFTADAAKVGMRAVVSHNDVVYLSPARQGWEGMPIGNGSLGAMVWQPDGMMFQLNTPLSGVYGDALARLRLRTTPTMLTGMRTYRQKLSLYEATLTTDIVSDSGRVNAVCLIPADTDALVLKCTDTRTGEVERFVELEAWRTSATRVAEGNTLLVTDTLKVQGEPDYRFAVAVEVEGAQSDAEKADEKAVRLRVAGGEFTMWLAVAATMEEKADVAAMAKEKLAAVRARGLGTLRKGHAEWWSRFWEKSFIKLTSEDGVADYVANLWYMHLYAMAAGSRGEVPPKFNGGLWTDNRDEREWGPAYWHWNTQETYWPLFAANHLELHKPYQDMYWNMLPTVKKWTKETWELDGAQYQETIPFNGAMGVWEKERGVHPRVPTPKHVAHTNLILSSSAEIAMQFWWYYLYTGDVVFLRDRAYPLMKEMATFYVGYLEKDGQGRYDMHPSNAHETFWKVKNPTTDAAALRYFFPAIIEASKRLEVDAELRAVWQDRLDHLAPYPADPATGAIQPYEPQPNEKVEVTNAENPDLFPIGVFPNITLGSPDYDVGVKTFYARRNVNVYGWTTDSITAARLGLAEPAQEGEPPPKNGLQWLLPNHADCYQNYPCGLQDYYGRKPGKHPYLEGSGTFATAVGEMLLQSWNNVIRSCPALPKAWSADFKLLAMGGFEVTGHAEKGQVKFVSLLSQRGEPAAIVNPFDASATVTCSGKPVLKSAEPIIKFPTKAGQVYVITRTGAPVAALEVTALPNDAPKHLSPASRRWIGRTEMASAGWKPPEEPDAPKPPAPVAQIERVVNPEVKPARFAAAPNIDGDLAEDVWKSARSLGPFFRLAQTTPAMEQTDALIGYDDKVLYVGITCWESRMDGLLADYIAAPENRDANVFQDDSVEIFLQPVPGPFWHFAVNALGATYDSRGSSAETDDARINPEWKAVAVRRSNRWTVEAAIPFDSIVPDAPRAGDSWGLNVCRNEKPHGETTTWAPLTQAMFHLPKDFGRLVFTEGVAGAQEKVPDPDLVGHWTFDDLKGLWVRDASGHRHYGLMTAPMKQVEGKAGKALEFSGAGFVDVAHAPDLNLTDAMTLAAWVMPKAVGSMRIIDKGPAGGADAYLLDTHPENNVRVITRLSTINAKETLPTNEWSHLAVTFGDRTLRAFLNGKVVAEATNLSGAITATQLPLRLGADSDGWSRFVGLMDEVRIYRKALSQDRVGALVRLTQ